MAEHRKKPPRWLFPNQWLTAMLDEVFHPPPPTVRRKDLTIVLEKAEIKLLRQPDHVMLDFKGARSRRIYGWDVLLEDAQLNLIIEFLRKIKADARVLRDVAIPLERIPKHA